MRGMTQNDGTYTEGILSLNGLTSTGVGNVIDSRCNYMNWASGEDVQPRQNLSLGAVSLAADTSLRLDANPTYGHGDYYTASSFSGSGSFVIDAINLNEESTIPVGNSYNVPIANSTLASHIKLASSVSVNTAYYKGGYSLSYNNSTGVLTLTKQTTSTYNLAGFLHLDTSGTTYTMTEDEITRYGIGAMAGSNNTKTVNAGDYIIHAYGSNAGVMVGEGQTLNINGGTWDGFKSDSGGAIYNNGSSAKIENITNSTFANNSAQGGGAINNYRGTISNITNTTFTNNSANAGGAILSYNGSTISNITNTTFTNNSVVGEGGAIFILKGTIGNITNSTFANNSAAARGGAIHNDTGGTISAITDSTFTNNSAENGGALYNRGGTITINATGGDVIFSNNTASQYGGAIYNGGTLTIGDSSTSSQNDHHITFENNSSVTGGGAIVFAAGSSGSIHNAIFNFNTANDAGGALSIAPGESTSPITISAIDATFTNNSAPNYGGAIFHDAYYTDTTSSIGAITGSFSNNISGAGGAIFNWSDRAGSKVYIGSIDADFIGNGATTYDGYIGGGAIYNGSAKKDNVDRGGISQIDAINGNFIKNYSTNGNGKAQGGAIYSTGIIGDIGTSTTSAVFSENYADSTSTNAYGGAIANQYGSIGDIVADFDGNYAKSTGEFKDGAGGVVISKDTDDNQGSGRAYGGAIFNLAQVTKDGDGNITGVVENTGVINSIQGEFKNNYVYSENGYAMGGAIYNEYGTIGSIGSETQKAVFENNSAESDGNAGGAIANIYGSIGDIYADFKYNSAKSSGEATVAIRNWNSHIDSINGDFEYNTAEAEGAVFGGVIYSGYNGIGTITGDFKNNTVTAGYYVQGGVIMNSNNDTIDTINANFENNTVTATSNIQGTVIENNTSASIINHIYGSFVNNSGYSTSGDVMGTIYNGTGTIGTIGSAEEHAQFSGNYARYNDH